MTKENLFTMEEIQPCLDLSEKLVATIFDGTIDKENPRYFFDVLMSVGLFTGKVLYAMEKAAHDKMDLFEFFKENVLPSVQEMLNEEDINIEDLINKEVN